MSEPTIICPKCKSEVKLNESLAAPLIESTRADYEQRLSQKDRDIALKEKSILEKEAQLVNANKELEAKIAQRIEAERLKISAEEAAKAKLVLGNDLDSRIKQVEELQEILRINNEKLNEAQKAQADLLRKERALDDAKRELDLTVEKRISEALALTRNQARKEAEDELKLKVSEKEQTISSMQKQIEELKRRAEQGSQQLQGEVQEVEIESLLKARFPFDVIEPVAKGEYGGDAVQKVYSSLNQICGSILWESKRTKNWSDAWLSKLRDDQRASKSEIAVLISTVLPKEVESFDFIDGIWVAHPRVAIPVALMLRQSLIELAAARKMSEGQQSKAEMLYSYLISPRFRLRVQAIVEAFSMMKNDLDKERKVITKQWCKREEQIERVMQATVGMYGDMQGIAGKTLQEIDGLELEALEEIT